MSQNIREVLLHLPKEKKKSTNLTGQCKRSIEIPTKKHVGGSIYLKQDRLIQLLNHCKELSMSVCAGGRGRDRGRESERERGAEGGRKGGQCAFHRAGSSMGMFDQLLSEREKVSRPPFAACLRFFRIMLAGVCGTEKLGKNSTFILCGGKE